MRYTHEDLKDNMWRNPGESGAGKENNGQDDDGDGLIDDVYGMDAMVRTTWHREHRKRKHAQAIPWMKTDTALIVLGRSGL